MTPKSYKPFRIIGMAIDPIHVGRGGARLGRVDLTIVRDPVTRVPTIPGSSLAGVFRSYAAMAQEDHRHQNQLRGTKPYYPGCAGQGQADNAGKGGHCGRADCPICTVFGLPRGLEAGLADFSDAHVLFFPGATREGPVWVSCPDSLRRIRYDIVEPLEDRAYQKNGGRDPLNLGWLLLERNNSLPSGADPSTRNGIPNAIKQKVVIVSDKLFIYIVNSNLEVRTSVAINPQTGAAEEGALFSYEALPRTTMLVWEVVCKNPRHFKVGGDSIQAQINGQPIDSSDKVFEVVKTAYPYLEHLGIGGTGTRGMGRLRVLHADAADAP